MSSLSDYIYISRGRRFTVSIMVCRGALWARFIKDGYERRRDYTRVWPWQKDVRVWQMLMNFLIKNWESSPVESIHFRFIILNLWVLNISVTLLKKLVKPLVSHYYFYSRRMYEYSYLLLSFRMFWYSVLNSPTYAQVWSWLKPCG